MIEGSFLGCVMQPTAACMTSPSFIMPFVLLALLTVVGFVARRIDVAAFRRLRRRALTASVVFLSLCLAIFAYYAAFDTATVAGTNTPPAAQTFFMMAVSGLGAAIALLFGSLGLALGGRIAKWTAGPRLVAPAGLVIAIDGPAASGKGTLAKRIADHFGLPCLDTGLLYRAVARDCQAAGGSLGDTMAALTAAEELDLDTLNDPALRGTAAGDAASLVARIPDVRRSLLGLQRRFAGQPGGAVLDGRDIGTVVCPNADVKLYVTATAEERARRRHGEHEQRGEVITYENVLADIQRRDARDRDRAIAPMEPAADAIRLDTTSLDADATFDAALRLIANRLPKARL